MGHHIWHEVQTEKKGRKVISGSFAPAGAGAVTDIKGAGVVSVARFAVGEFVIFVAKHVELESLTLSLQLAAATDRFVMFAFHDVVPQGINIKVTDNAGAAADIAADANNRINFTAVIRNN
jgi:hypothetical protein